MTEIRFIKPCWSATYGAFDSGDILRCSEAVARHFVQDAQAAEVVRPVAPSGEQAPPAKRVRRKASE